MLQQRELVLQQREMVLQQREMVLQQQEMVLQQQEMVLQQQEFGVRPIIPFEAFALSYFPCYICKIWKYNIAILGRNY